MQLYSDMHQKVRISKGLFIVTFIVFMMASCLSSCRNSSSDRAKRVREYVCSIAEKDSSGFAVKIKKRLDSLTKISENDEKKIYGVVNEYSRHLLSTGRHIEAIRLMEGEEAILTGDNHIETEDIRQLLSIYVGLGAAYDETGMPGIGLDCYSKGLQLASDTVFDKYKAMLYNNIGVLYNRSSRNDMAEQYFRKSLQINLKTNLKKEIFLNYNNLATVFDEEGELKKALDASLSGLQYINAEDDPEDFYCTQIALGSLYSRNRDMEMARSYLQNGLEHLESINFVPGRIDAYKQLARHYLAIGQLDSAETYGNKALRLSESASLAPLEISSLEVLSDTHVAQGDYNKAVIDLKRCDELKDSLRNEENKLRLKEWEKISNQEFERGKTVNASIAYWWKVIAVIFIILFLLTLTLILVKRKYYRKEVSRLSREIDRLNREMTSLSIDHMKEHEGIESVLEDLGSLFQEVPMKNISQKTRSRSIIAKLNHISDNATDEFKHYFDKVHPDFYFELETRYPDLTARDIRLCALLMLGLSTKEIAAITYREVRSVESARNRLRKKLGLDMNVNLPEFLRALGRNSV